MALDGGCRSASAIALESVSCSVVTRQNLRDAITKDPDIALKIIALLIGRARLATDKIKDLALHDVYQRHPTAAEVTAQFEPGIAAQR